MRCPKMYAAAGMLLFMLSPLAIAESVTTQTDLTSTAIFLIFVYFILKLGLNNTCCVLNSNFVKDLVACAISVGIGFLTKISICFMMIPFLIWLGIYYLLRRIKMQEIMKSCLIASVIILIFMTPTFIRNMNSIGSILPMEETRLMIKTGDPKLILINIYKNLTLETVGDKDAGPMYNVTTKLAEKLNVDIENPEITAYSGKWPKKIDRLTENYLHDNAGSQKLFLLFGISLVLGIVYILVKIFGKIFWGGRKENYIGGLLCMALRCRFFIYV